MRSLAIFIALFAAVVHTIPTLAVHQQARRAPQYYCSHAYQFTHVFHTTYIISGRGSLVHEPLLRKAVESTPLCTITRWDYVDDDDGEGRNDFDLMFDFPLGCQARLEKKLGELLGESIMCPKVEWKKHLRVQVGLHDDLYAYTDWEESHD